MKIEHITSAFDGLSLELAISVPAGTPRGIVQISHGMAEHKERYFGFMEYLSQNGFICIIHDHRGHGASVRKAEDLGYFYTADPDGIVNDLHQVTLYVKEHYPELPVYLFSHSMGTLVARNYLKKYDGAIEKLVLCGPPTYNGLSWLAIVLAHLTRLFRGDHHRSAFLNRLSDGSYNKGYRKEGEWLNSDRGEVERYHEDPLCGYTFTVSGYLNLFRLLHRAYRTRDWKVSHPELKILIIAGADDPVIQSPEKVDHLARFLQKRGYEVSGKKLYPGKKHELLLEKEREEIYRDILHFLIGQE